MKNYKLQFSKKTYFFFTLCMISISTLFFGCNESSHEEKLVEINNDRLAKDMKGFYIRHNELIQRVLSDTSTTNRVRSFDSSVSLIEENLKQLAYKYEFLSDESGKNVKKTCLDEDSILMMQDDHELFLSYIKKEKSNKFFDIYKGIIKKGYLDMSEDDIISNKQLCVSEKMSLLLALPVLENSMPLVENKRIKTRTESSDVCLNGYESDRLSCGISYGISCVLSCTGGVFIAGIGVVYATYELNSCLGKANERYMMCRKYGN